MSDYRGGHRRRSTRSEPTLRALESRLDRLEVDVETVLHGGSLRPPPSSRPARWSLVLSAAGAILILVAIALVIF